MGMLGENVAKTAPMPFEQGDASFSAGNAPAPSEAYVPHPPIKRKNFKNGKPMTLRMKVSTAIMPVCLPACAPGRLTACVPSQATSLIATARF